MEQVAVDNDVVCDDVDVDIDDTRGGGGGGGIEDNGTFLELQSNLFR